MPLIKMSDLKLKGKRVLIREDLNVPIKNGEMTSDTRIQAAIPTIQQALKQGAQVMIMSHLGRPTEGSYQEQFSLAPVAKQLSKLLKKDVPLIQDWLKGFDLGSQKIVLLENVRFNTGEADNNPALAEKMAKLCDVFVMDAFATAHRAEASTCGIVQFAPVSCAGPLLLSELEALDNIMQKPNKPVVAIVGGSKVSTKLTMLESLVQKVDYLIVGGGIANTFIAAEGYHVGKSLHEPDFLDEAERLVTTAKKRGAEIIIPTDVVVGEKLSEESESAIRLVSQVDNDEKIYDIGPDTIQHIAAIIKKAKTILWNGPVGAFEISHFAAGTKAVAKAIADSKAFSVAGGGDTLAAIEEFGVAKKISYISTGGGAFLTFIEGKELPAIHALNEGATKKREKA